MKRMRKWLRHKKRRIIVIMSVVVLVAIVLLMFRGFSGEDNWIQDTRGIYVMHGNPDEVPEKVKLQESALRCAQELYLDMKSVGVKPSSQCLGVCFGYAVDVVHNPRIADDDKKENQCGAFLNGSVKKFIEIDKTGQILKVV